MGEVTNFTTEDYFDQTMVMRLPEISTQFLPYARVFSIRYLATCKTSTEGIDKTRRQDERQDEITQPALAEAIRTLVVFVSTHAGKRVLGNKGFGR